MVFNCGKSWCAFMQKCFNLKNDNKKRVNYFNISTKRTIKSQDLNRYLFADECESCKNRNKTSIKILKNNSQTYEDVEYLGVYEPPINIGSCDSFRSINSDQDSETDVESDIDSEDEPKQIMISKFKTKKMRRSINSYNPSELIDKNLL